MDDLKTFLSKIEKGNKVILVLSGLAFIGALTEKYDFTMDYVELSKVIITGGSIPAFNTDQSMTFPIDKILAWGK